MPPEQKSIEQREREKEMSQMSLRVLIIGGGLGGLCLAQGLRKAGINVAVYERDHSPESRAQGYRFHLDVCGEQALHECLPSDLYRLLLATRGQSSNGMTLFHVVYGRLQEMFTVPFPIKENNEFLTAGHAVDRLVIRQILLSGLDDAVHFGKAFTRYEQLQDGTVRAHFADGSSASGDVLVAADGVNSRVREQFLPHDSLIDTGTRWLGGKTPLTSELRSLLPAQLAETFGAVTGMQQNVLFGLVEFMQDPNQVAARLMPGLHFHDTMNYAFWGVLAQRHQLTISDDELSSISGAGLHQLLLELSADWPPALRTLITQCQPDQNFILKMRHSRSIEQWQTTNITLLGDAIHAVPIAGSGANTALRDASLLARSLIAVADLGAPLQQALHDYESEMIPYGFDVLQASLRRADIHKLDALRTSLQRPDIS
jgi:2-polyprenyl-6-methoxyphenol hydroxylase-like FAD-dependent oxidoreductase